MCIGLRSSPCQLHNAKEKYRHNQIISRSHDVGECNLPAQGLSLIDHSLNPLSEQQLAITAQLGIAGLSSFRFLLMLKCRVQGYLLIAIFEGSCLVLLPLQKLKNKSKSVKPQFRVIFGGSVLLSNGFGEVYTSSQTCHPR